MSFAITHRTRRLRTSEALRGLVEENQVSPAHLIYPLFVMEGQGRSEAIGSMPGIFRYTPDRLLEEIGQSMELGVKSFCLFPKIADGLKDSTGTASEDPSGLYPATLHLVKQHFPDCVLMTDVALDPYSSDGHDGIVQNGRILNDETVEVLCRMAVVQAQAGADLIGPSDMMDGRVGAIRQALDAAGYPYTGIISYTAKYASSFYGPFREALDSAPRGGDKKSYQMNPANRLEAYREAELDIAEGADLIMVKPGLPYLDIIRQLADRYDTPIAAYNVSGEYAMIKAAAQNGWLDGTKAMAESLLAFRRAGAQVILTYFAKEFAQWYKSA